MKILSLTALPLVLALALASSCSDSTASAGHAGVSTSNIEDADANRFMELQRRLLNDTTEVLADVTDADSARAARSKLETIGERVAPMRKRKVELMNATPEDKAAFALNALSMLSDISQVTHEFQRLYEIPGVAEELEAPMQKIFSFFHASDD